MHRHEALPKGKDHYEGNTNKTSTEQVTRITQTARLSSFFFA